MKQKTHLVLRFVSMFIMLVFHGSMPQAINAQSAYMMKYLPQDPTLPRKIEAPKGSRRWVALKEEIWNDKVKTDTVSIKIYDAQGRKAEHIFFSSGKRESHYFDEYPDTQTTRFYTIMKLDSKTTVRDYNEIMKDTAGNIIDASSYHVTDEGKTIMINDHDYVYDSKMRLIYQCDLCNLSSHIKRYFRYRDLTLLKLYETNLDTFGVFDISDMTYDPDGRMTRYTYRHISKGDTALQQDQLYTYEAGRLVRHMQFNYFENGWREYIYRYDSAGRISRSYQIIGDDTTTIEYHFEGDRLMSEFLTTSFMYSEGFVFFSSKFKESLDGKHHTTETKYTYDKDDLPVITEHYWDGVLRRRYRNVFE